MTQRVAFYVGGQEILTTSVDADRDAELAHIAKGMEAGGLWKIDDVSGRSWLFPTEAIAAIRITSDADEKRPVGFTAPA
jgi:hypothetical protein